MALSILKRVIMKKRSFLFILLFTSIYIAFAGYNYALISASAKTEITITLEDETVQYSLKGYYPKAKVSHSSVVSQITYSAVDIATSQTISLPLDKPGKYEITASFQGNEKYSSAKATSVVTIESVKAKIITNYHTVAYSKMDNPVSYSIEPSWAKDFLDIDIKYFPIDDISSVPQNPIEAPKDLGLFYTVFNVTSSNPGIECENKYLVYEIAPYRGKKLSAEERGLSVPPSFTCKFENITTVYNPSTPIECKYTLSPVAIEGEIMYKTTYRDGTYSPYTKDIPTEPGEYVCGYFLGSTCIGEGSIFIDKIQTTITVNSVETPYIFGGVSPTAKSEISGMDISFTAFAIDENGNTSMEETSIPIKKAGKYSIIAYPTDTKHYKRTYAYGYLTITPATPEIKVITSEFEYNGEEQHIQISVSPEDVLFKTEYYKWNGGANHTILTSPPKEAGDYLAVVTAYDNNGNYIPTTQSINMKITDKEKDNNYLLPIILSACVVISACGVVFFLKHRKNKRK